MDVNDTCDSACSQVSFFISLEFWINFTEDCFHAKPEAEEMYRPRLLSQSPGALPLSDESAHLSLFIPCSLVAENYRRYYHKEKNPNPSPTWENQVRIILVCVLCTL